MFLKQSLNSYFCITSQNQALRKPALLFLSNYTKALTKDIFHRLEVTTDVCCTFKSQLQIILAATYIPLFLPDSKVVVYIRLLGQF